MPTNPAELERLAHVATDASGDWSSLILARADGQQLLHTGAAPGTALPTLAGRPYLEEALRRRAPVVTDVIPSQLRGKPIVRVVQPILREGEASQVLIVDLELSAFDALLSGRVVREGGIGAILDGEQRFIARSRDSERVLGTVDAALEARLADLEGGFTKLTSPEGVSLYEVWARAPLTGWTVILGVPVAPHEAALQRSLLGLGGAGLALFLLVGLVALTWARRLARSISSATDAAVALAERRSLPPIGSVVFEVEELAAALSRTSALLHAQDEERDRLLVSESEARALAERQSRAKDEFLAMLGHELRNPLAAIRTAVALLERQRDERTQGLARDMVKRQTATLTRLVDDLLDVARVAAGKIRIVKARVRLDELVRHALHALFGLAPSHELVVDTEPVWVDGDATRLEQIVTNLIGNARKFTPPGGRIEVSLRAVGEDVVLEVRDAGSGISAHLLPRVFELFVQGEQGLDRRAGGLGIGLTLVKHLVALHGGEVRATSRGQGLGSTFTVRLPRAPAAEPASLSRGSRDERPGRPRRVAVIEDNDDARVSLVTLLRAWGHEVHEAADGFAGVALIDATDPDVVIVDIGLPGLDGYGVARRVRDKDGGRTPRLIALTGYGGREDRKRSEAAGFDEHLVKPVDPDVLSRVVGEPAELGRAS